jgi:hypothetical protein
MPWVLLHSRNYLFTPNITMRRASYPLATAVLLTAVRGHGTTPRPETNAEELQELKNDRAAKRKLAPYDTATVPPPGEPHHPPEQLQPEAQELKQPDTKNVQIPVKDNE